MKLKVLLFSSLRRCRHFSSHGTLLLKRTPLVLWKDSLRNETNVACVASVSNRVIARKLEREQKKGKEEGTF